MTEVTVQINNRGYSLSCDAGQEQRIADLAHYVDSRLKDIAAAGAASTESHMLVLTSLVMADELFELREEMKALRQYGVQDQASQSSEDEAMIAEAIDHLAGKIEHIASRIHSAEAA